MRKFLALIYIFVFFFFLSAETVFSATTDKDFTLDDGTTDSPSLNLKDQGDFSLILQKTDAGDATILNNEPSGSLRLIPSNDTDDYIYLSTAADLPGLFWAGVAAYTNDPSIRISATGKLEYRDQDELTYTPFDSLAAGVATFNDLADVVITGAAQGDLVFYNGTNWVNLAPGTSGQVLQTQGAGANPVWAAGSTASLSGLTPATTINTIDSLDFAQAWNWSTADAETPLSMSANALTSGTLLSLTSTSTGLTGDLNKVELTGANTANTGNVLKVGYTGTTGTATAVNVTNAGTGLSFRVNDDGTYADASAFVVDASGNVGIGDLTPASALTVGAGDKFQVDSTGDVVRIDNVTYDWPGSQGGVNTVLTNDGSGVLSWTATLTGDITSIGDVTSGVAFDGTQGNTLIFEGATADTNEITVLAADPAADFTITIPAVTGTLITTGDTGSITSTMVANDALDFIDFENTLDLDADLILNQTTNTWVQNFTGTTTTGFTYAANSLTAGAGVSVASSATGLTGDLNKIELTGANTGNTGNVLKVGYTGTTGTAVAVNVTNAGTGLSFRINDDGTYADSTPVVVDASGNLGVGDATPASLFTVGSGDKFQVDANGDLIKINNITYSWPASQGGVSSVLTNDGSGALTWSAASSITSLSSLSPATTINTIDSLDFAQAWNWSTADAETPLSMSANALTSGTLLSLTSTSTGLTGDLNKVELTGANTANTGNVLKVGYTGTTGTATAVNVTNAGTGLSFRVNDDGTYADASAFVVDASGNVGVGDLTPASALTVGAGDKFQVDSTGDVVRIDNVTYDWPGSQGGVNTVLTNDGSGVLSWTATLTGDITSIGDVTSGVAFDGTQGNTLIFEGATADTNEITVLAADPAADFTITIPAVTGTLITDGDTGTITSTMVANDALDFIDFDNTLDLDANLILNQTTNTWVQNFTGTTTTGFTYAADSLTAGAGVSVASSATGLTGDLNKIELTGANTGNTGNVLKVGYTGTTGTAVAVNVTNAGTGLSFRINDDGTYADSTPVVVDASGSVGIGTSTPNTKFEIDGTYSQTPSSLTSLAGGGQLTATKSVMRVQSTGGAVTLGTPAVAAGVSGQMLTILGSSDTDTVQFVYDPALRLTRGVSFTMGSGDVLLLIYDVSISAWVELNRSDN